jgi:hypothetical protein
MRHVGEVGAKHLDGFAIEIDCGKTAQSGSFQAEAETAAAAKQIDESGIRDF